MLDWLAYLPAPSALRLLFIALVLGRHFFDIDHLADRQLSRRATSEPSYSSSENGLSTRTSCTMIPRMSRFFVRVVCHAVLRIDLEPQRVRGLEAEVQRRCDEANARLTAFVVDLGAPKRSPEEYPALDPFRAGKADALMVVRVPLADHRNHGDLLTEKTLTGGLPIAWVPAYELRRLGLLPPAINVTSFARLRAAALRELRFPIEAIARWLDAEGYAPLQPQSDHWTRSDVQKLLRKPLKAAPPMPPDFGCP